MAGQGAGASPAPRRRDEALAFIIERIVRDRVSPTGPQIACALKISETRAKQLIAQLVAAGSIERIPGAKGGLRVRDVSHARGLLGDVLTRLGWSVSVPMGAPLKTFPQRQLPMLPPIEHLPDDYAGESP